ncbi:Uncharacterised protein [Neisseria meningitidis]|nr:Uncharacterised protein [Neisseria meningitidis]
MPSENLSDGIFACKSEEDFAPADSFHTARRAGNVQAVQIVHQQGAHPFLGEAAVVFAGTLAGGVYTAAARITVCRC